MSSLGTAVVTSRSFSSGALDLTGPLRRAGLDVVRCASNHDPEVLRPHLADAVAWIAGTGPVGPAHLDLAPKLRVLARYGVGIDAVDLAAAAKRGITVTNTPGANSEAVTEHALALLFSVIRGVPAGDRRVRAGDWSVSRGRQLAGSTAGVVGFGRIGQGVAARLKALGCHVLVQDPAVPSGVVGSAGHEAVPPDRMVQECTVVSLHAPGGGTIIGPDWVERCLRGQVVVNTARADLVDEQAVAHGLHAGRLGGYATDTLTTEATGGTSPVLDPELADRVVLTPHLGAQTTEALDLMGSMAVDSVLDVLAGREPEHPVLARTPSSPDASGGTR